MTGESEWATGSPRTARTQEGHRELTDPQRVGLLLGHQEVVVVAEEGVSPVLRGENVIEVVGVGRLDDRFDGLGARRTDRRRRETAYQVGVVRRLELEVLERGATGPGLPWRRERLRRSGAACLAPAGC